MTDFFDATTLATFDAGKVAKVDVARGERLFLGLNCLEPGQSQAIHTHADGDKFYLVASGKARITVGSRTELVGPGQMAWCAAGVPHGIAEALERTVIVVGMSPPPTR